MSFDNSKSNRDKMEYGLQLDIKVARWFVFKQKKTMWVTFERP
jgi:hypothetical protein